jgi:hypothetical protein
VRFRGVWGRLENAPSVLAAQYLVLKISRLIGPYGDFTDVLTQVN